MLGLFFSPVCYKEMGSLIFFKFLTVCTTCLSLTIYESPFRTWNSDMLNFYYISMTFKKHNEELLSFFNNAPLHGTGFLLYLKDGDLGVKFTLLSVQNKLARNCCTFWQYRTSQLMQNNLFWGLFYASLSCNRMHNFETEWSSHVFSFLASKWRQN